jgi:hypothetical protein
MRRTDHRLGSGSDTSTQYTRLDARRGGHRPTPSAANPFAVIPPSQGDEITSTAAWT